MKLRDLSVGKKIGAAFLFVAVSVCALGVGLLHELDRIKAETLELTNETIPSINLVTDMNIRYSRIRKDEYSLVANTGKNYTEQWCKELEVDLDAFEKVLDAYEATLWDENDRNAFYAINDTWDMYKQGTYQVIAKVRANDPVGSNEIIVKSLNTYLKMVDAIEKLTQVNAAYVDVHRKNAHEFTSRAYEVTIGAIGVLIVLMVIINYYLNRIITRPLSQVVAIAENIANGDLTHEIEIDHM